LRVLAVVPVILSHAGFELFGGGFVGVDGKINLVVRYGSKPLEFAKGKNAIELANEGEVADALRKVREDAELGELDALIEQQAHYSRRVTQKSK